MRISVIFSLLILAFPQAACIYVSEAGGDRETRTSRPEPFAQVAIPKNFAHVAIEVCDGCSPSVRIEGDDRQIDEVEVSNSGDTLTLSRSGKVVVTNINLTADVRTATLEGLTVASSTDVDVNGIDTEVFEVVSAGSGDVSLSGRAGVLDLTMTGSGDVEAFAVEAETVDVVGSGSGDAEVCASELVRGRLTGSGDLTYDCSPAQVDVTETGSGDAGVR